MHRESRNTVRLLTSVVGSRVYKDDKKWKDEKKERYRCLKRGGKKMYTEAYDGVKEIKVTEDMSYFTTTTNHHQLKRNGIDIWSTSSGKPWWNLSLLSPTLSESSSIAAEQGGYNNNLLLHKVPKKRVSGSRKTEYNSNPKKQEKKQILLKGRRIYANQLKHSTNNYKLDGCRDKDRLQYICDFDDKQKVYSNAGSATVSTTFVVHNTYDDDCFLAYQQLNNVDKDKSVYVSKRDHKQDQKKCFQTQINQKPFSSQLHHQQNDLSPSVVVNDSYEERYDNGIDFEFVQNRNLSTFNVSMVYIEAYEICFNILFYFCN